MNLVFGIRNQNYNCQFFVLVDLQLFQSSVFFSLLNVSAEKDRQKIFNAFQVEFGRDLSPIELEMINDWIEEDKYKTDLILLALREAVLSQAYNLKYIDRILLSWEKQGIRSKVDVENLKKAREKRKENINTISDNNKNKENKPKIPLTKWLD